MNPMNEASKLLPLLYGNGNFYVTNNILHSPAIFQTIYQP